MSDLVQAITNRLPAQGSAIYRGKITAVNTTTGVVTVLLAAGSIASLQWLSPYVPAVDDIVAVVRDGTDWIVLGELSTNTVAVPVNATVVVGPDIVNQGDYHLFQTNGAGDPASWLWSTAAARQGRTEVRSSYTSPEYGYYDPITFEWIVGTPSVTTNYYTRDDYGALARLTVPTLPAGSTITSAKIRVTRLGTSSAGNSTVSPVIYGHTLNSTPSGALTSYLHASYGPWKPGTLAKGQTARWDLPSGWITAFMAGTLQGFGVWSNASTDASEYEAASISELTINYTYTP